MWSPSLKRIAPLVTGVGWLRLASRSLQVEALRFQVKQRPRASGFTEAGEQGGTRAPSVSRSTGADERGCSWTEALGRQPPCWQV